MVHATTEGVLGVRHAAARRTNHTTLHSQWARAGVAASLPRGLPAAWAAPHWPPAPAASQSGGAARAHVASPLRLPAAADAPWLTTRGAATDPRGAVASRTGDRAGAAAPHTGYAATPSHSEPREQ